jgi:hypothetical protein
MVPLSTFEATAEASTPKEPRRGVTTIVEC